MDCTGIQFSRHAIERMFERSLPPLERGKTVVIREGPANICENCGEYYLDSPVAQDVYDRAEAAVARNAEVEILRYAA